MPSGPKAKKSGATKNTVLSGGALKALVQTIEKEVLSLASAQDLEFLAVETPLENGWRIIRVIVDVLDSGLSGLSDSNDSSGSNGSKVTIDQCTKIARQLSARLDELDPEDGPGYILEVSSPGLDRRLVTEKDFRRFSGSLAKIKLTLDGKTATYRGRLDTKEGPFRIITPQGEITFGLSPDLKARLIPEI
jgi:ribosome maturation factor RimP